MGLPAAVPLIVGTAASLAGAGLGVASTRQNNKAMNDAVASNLAGQRNYANEASKIFNANVAQSTPQTYEQNRQLGNAVLLDAYEKAQRVPMSQNSTPLGSAVLVDNPKVSASAELLNARNATMGSFNFTDLDQAIRNLQAQGRLGRVSYSAADLARQLETSLASAQQKAQGQAALGSALSSIGAPAVMYGAMELPNAPKKAVKPEQWFWDAAKKIS